MCPVAAPLCRRLRVTFIFHWAQQVKWPVPHKAMAVLKRRLASWPERASVTVGAPTTAHKVDML